MFLRAKNRFKDGKQHRYWSIAENCRCQGHLLITLLAYHFVMTVRKQFKASGIDDSWQTIRRTMGNQHRITVTMKCAEGRTVHVRKATRAEPMQKSIYNALGMGSQPGKVVKTFVSP